MTKTNNPLIISVITAAVLVLCAVPAFSASYNAELPHGLQSADLPNREGVKAGPIRVHAAAKDTEQFETNIYLNNTDRKADIITIISPSVGVELPVPLGEESSISADYEVSPYMYGTYHSENHIDHRARGLMELNFNDYKVTVSDTFRIFTNRADNEDSLRLKQDTNVFQAALSADYELLGYEVGYKNSLQIYDSNDLAIAQLTYEDRNYDDNMAYALMTYRFLPKTLLVVENDLGYIRHFNTSQIPDSVYDDSLVGIKGEWFSKVNVNLKAGFRYQGYDKSDVIAHKSYVGTVIRGGFDFSPTDADMIIVALERTPRESTYSNMNYYTANLAGVTYKHQFNDKITGGLFGSYQLHQYPSQSTSEGVTAKREDNYFSTGVSVRYDIRKWISVEAKYTFNQRVSKFDIYDYFDNVASLSGTIGF